VFTTRFGSQINVVVTPPRNNGGAGGQAAAGPRRALPACLFPPCTCESEPFSSAQILLKLALLCTCPLCAAITAYVVLGIPVSNPAGTPTIFSSGMGTAMPGGRRQFTFTAGTPTVAGKYK